MADIQVEPGAGRRPPLASAAQMAMNTARPQAMANTRTSHSGARVRTYKGLSGTAVAVAALVSPASGSLAAVAMAGRRPAAVSTLPSGAGESPSIMSVVFKVTTLIFPAFQSG